jgi:hypothetical protein
MGKDKSTNVEEKMALVEEIAVGHNVSLRDQTGVGLVAIGCAPCGRFLGWEHNKPPATCSGGKDDPHESTPATRFFGESVTKTKKVNGVVFMMNGTPIPGPDDPDAMEAQAKALMERAAAARKKE